MIVHMTSTRPTCRRCAKIPVVPAHRPALDRRWRVPKAVRDRYPPPVPGYSDTPELFHDHLTSLSCAVQVGNRVMKVEQKRVCQVTHFFKVSFCFRPFSFCYGGLPAGYSGCGDQSDCYNGSRSNTDLISLNELAGSISKRIFACQ